MKTSVRNNPYSNEAAQEARRATLQQLGISNREAREYSLSRALLGLADGRFSGYEKECSEQLNRQGHQTRTNSAFLVPTGMVLARDLNVQSSAAGGYLVGTQNMSFIDLLRSNLICAQMGATVLPGLRENITVPKLSAGATAHWLANDSTAITESTQTLGQVSLTPKNVGAYTEVSRQLLMQSNPAADWVIANDLAKTVAQAIDAAAINGSGASGQPTGVLNVAGIGSVTGTSLAYAGILEFMSDTIGQNALINPESAGFVTTPTVSALLMNRQKVASTFSPIWQGNVRGGTIDGMRAMSSTAVPAGTMLFADWSSLLIGEWGILEIESNPYANFAAGIVGVRAIQTIDVAVRYPQSFSAATSIT